LTNAENNLVYNVITLADELATKVTVAVKEIDSLLSVNKSGLSLDKSIEEFGKLSAAYTDIGSFDEIFVYNTALGKYVYTIDGIKKSIEHEENNLATTRDQLEEATALD